MSFEVEEEEEEAFEHTLLVVREVSVYKIPPRSTSGGYKCGEWLQSDKIWSGRIRVVSRRDRCEIRLEDPSSGELFAACFVYPGQRETAVEPVLDSSRYFVLKIEDGQGKHAFIGLGFNERNEAFDFNVALSDHEKYVRREHERRSRPRCRRRRRGVADRHSPRRQSQAQGETIRINVKHKSTSGNWHAFSCWPNRWACCNTKPKTVSLAPPPSGAGKIRSPLPPPPNDPVAARIASTGCATGPKGTYESVKHSTDALSDFFNFRQLGHCFKINGHDVLS
ncbi:hypothetical protein JHK82_047694 [Glycine max]|nr:hypothetical protein JHK82_047694 [Glycine max]